MTLDELQSRLRAVFDATLARAVEAKAAHDASLGLLWAEVESGPGHRRARLWGDRGGRGGAVSGDGASGGPGGMIRG